MDLLERHDLLRVSSLLLFRRPSLLLLPFVDTSTVAAVDVVLDVVVEFTEAIETKTETARPMYGCVVEGKLVESRKPTQKQTRNKRVHSPS